jgi:hypothetical protein
MTSTTVNRPVSGSLAVLGPGDIDALPWQPVPGCRGVQAAELLRFGDDHDALISYQPGTGTPGRPHPAAYHHIWVVSGTASMAGRRLVPGSYVYVPPDTPHPITDVGPEGCTLLQVHRRVPNA